MTNQMKTNRTTMHRSLTLLIALLLTPPAALRAAPPSSSFGVWADADIFDAKEYPFVKGLVFNNSWADIEREPGVFNWSGLDQAVEKATQNKMYLFLALEAGPGSPEWIYEHGVPKVFTDDKTHLNKWKYYPYYLAPAYKKYYERLLLEFGKHIRSYPKEAQERIAFIQVKTGCTGDECAYKSKPLVPQYDLPKSSPEWRAFRLETFALYAKLFDQGPAPKISLLFNSIYPDDESEGEGKWLEEWKWATSTLKDGFGIKNGALSRGHHLSGECAVTTTFLPYLVDPKGLTLFRRSEMDQTWQKAWYQLNVPLSFYWGAINALNAGQSVWNVSKSALRVSKEQGFDYSFYFFNKYAGQIYPKTATDAFCALHKGLDAADTNAYPEAKFGTAGRRNVDRMLKICAEYSKYGASADDKDALTMGQVAQRDSQTGFNDVGWDIWPDNYSRFFYQIDADATSIPRWRVGGPITKKSSIYSRFARGFEHATGRDAMYFKLHEGFSQDTKPKVMSVHVVWYDDHKGSAWKLVYDAGEPAMKTALTVSGKGDQQWHDETVTLNDAVLFHGGTKGSDLALVNLDDQDDIFSLIEVHRGRPEMPELRPPAKYEISDNAPKPPKTGKSKSDKKNRKGTASDEK
jgi:hypothetical protein